MNMRTCIAKEQGESNIHESLNNYKNRTEKKIQDILPSLGPKSKLRDACEYALTNGGKRFRPALVFMVADAIGYRADVSYAALAVEFFHTASLIADDLPCMDDDDERRDKPSLHKAYGESIALLASYALIAHGYECLAKNTQTLHEAKMPHSAYKDRICTLALENATYNTGLSGATGGQFLDIFPPDLSMETLRDVIRKKTCSLFEISFVFGWLYGGGRIEFLPQVKQAAAHFGIAFQIADDLGDVGQDAANERRVNMAGVFGLDAAKRMFHEEIQGYKTMLKELNINVPSLMVLADLLIDQVSKY